MKATTIIVKKTGEVKTAIYFATPSGNLRYHVDCKPYSDRTFDKLFVIPTSRAKEIIKLMQDGAALVEYSYTGQEWSLHPKDEETIDLWKMDDRDAIKQLSNLEIIKHDGVCRSGKAQYYELTEIGKNIKF